MKAIEGAAHYLVNSGGVLALSASAMTAGYSIIFNAPQDIFLLAIPFFLTFSSYHINRKAELDEDGLTHTKRTEFIKQNYWLDILAIFGYLLALALALLKNLESFLIVLVPPILVAFYTFKFLRRFKRLKEVTVGKNIVVSLGWTLYVFLAAAYFNIPFNMTVFALAGFVFFRLFVNTVVFDLRDIVADRRFNVPTIPVTIGKEKTIRLLLIVNMLGGLYLFCAIFLGLLPPFAHALNAVTIYGYYFILKAGDKKTDQDFLCDIIVDGEYILWPFLLFAGKIVLGFP